MLKIGNSLFKLVKKRANLPVSVYSDGSRFLRLGPGNIILPELELHKSLLNYGFPVAALLEEGEYEGNNYFIEQSVGDEILGIEFMKDTISHGYISDANFYAFLKMCELFARAQIKTKLDTSDYEGFYIGIHMDTIQDELPELADLSIKGYEKLKVNTESMPFVISHGDFNPHNILRGGVIDFGTAHNAPAGYDVVNSIFHTYNFPKDTSYELSRIYEFTPEQILEYLERIDNVYNEFNLPSPSSFKDDFVFAKIVWSTTKISRYPKLQKWRYERYEKVLRKYVNDEPLNYLDS